MTTIARLRADEAAAWRVADLFTLRFDPATTACAVYEADGGWVVALYLDRAARREAVRDLVAAAAGKAAARSLEFETIADRDWIATSLAGLKPVEAGRFVVHGHHDRARVAINRVGIEIEAALAFGTGHHGTTRGCLIAIDRILKAQRPRRILDLGTGSGVLAIAAAKARRTRVLASDIDRGAVAVARANTRANGVGSLIDVVHTGGLDRRIFRARAYDLVLANILLGTLTCLAASMARLAAPRSRVVLSGLLPAQARAALAAYRAQGLALERRILLDGWVTLVLTRR